MLGLGPPGPPWPPEVHSVRGLPWGGPSLLVEGPLPGRRESARLLFCPSLCSTNHALPFTPSAPAPAGYPLSISCRIFPVLQTMGRSPTGLFAKRERETGRFEPGTSEGSAGYPESRGWMWGWQPLHTFWLIPSHLTCSLEERIAESYSIDPVLRAFVGTLGRCRAIGPRDPGLLTPVPHPGIGRVVFPVVKG